MSLRARLATLRPRRSADGRSRFVKATIRAPRWIAAFTALAAFAACSSGPRVATRSEIPLLTPAPAAKAASAPAGIAPFSLASGDEFDVKVMDAPQFDQTVKVRPDGKVSLNLIGAVFVAGRTPEDVQQEIRERYTLLAGSPGPREYVIHANDELEIKLPYYQQLNDQMRVRPDGKIQLQLAGTIQAEGKTPEELETELKSRYALQLKEPEVTVIVRTATSQDVRTATGIARGGLAGLRPVVMVRTFQVPQVFITGEVARPGMVPYTQGLTLLQALAESGGHLPSGDVTKIVVLRKTTAQTAEVLRPELTKTYRSDPSRDMILEPYDVVLLPPTRAQNLAEALDRYVYKLFAPLKNSSFGYVYSSARVIP